MSFPKIRSSSVLAVGIALSPVVSTPTEAVGADSSCEQVVDTTRMATGMSARLSQAIFDIQEDGVIVAVRLREGEPDTASESAIRHFNEGLVYRCSLGEKALVVTVDFGPRKYDIYRGAGINRSLIPNSKVDSALPSFRDNLRDTASPPQDDVAALIQSLDPTPHNQGTTTADKQNSNPNPSFNVSEIPWEGILKGVSTAGLLGGIIFAFRRRKSAVIIFNEAVAIRDASISLSASVLNDARALYGKIEGADRTDPSIKQLMLELAMTIDRIKSTQYHTTSEGSPTPRDSSSQTPQDARPQPYRNMPAPKAFWPTKNDALAFRDALGNLAPQANELSETLGVRLRTDRELVDGFLNNIGAAETQRDKVIEIYNGLQDAGWDMSSLPLSEEKLESAIHEIYKQWERGDKLRAAQAVKKLTEEQSRLIDRVAKLTQRRINADKHIEDQTNRISTIRDQILSTRDVLSRIRNDYSGACTESLNGKEDEIDSLLTKLIEKNNAAIQRKGVLRPEAVDDADVSNKSFDDTHRLINDALGQVVNRAKTLSDLRETLPATLAQLEEQREEIARSYNSHSDVSSSSKSSIANLVSDIEKLRSLLHKPRPNYLEIEAALKKAEEKLISTRRQAVQDIADVEAERQRERDRIRREREAREERARQAAVVTSSSSNIFGNGGNHNSGSF